MHLKTIGKTESGQNVLAGAFQMADTEGFPLTFSMDEASRRNCVVSFPHYFASAMEHGWDDEQTFSKIREALSDRGELGAFERIKTGCTFMFMRVAETMPGQPATAVGKKMREEMV